jgi:hypothetical protein
MTTAHGIDTAAPRRGRVRTSAAGDRRRRMAALALSTLALVLAARPAAAQQAFFRPDTALPVTLRTDLRHLARDTDTSKTIWRAATLTYAGPDGPVTVPLEVRTRGLFRREHCDLPPIRLRFQDSTSRGTVFEHLRHPKLVVHCENNDEFEQYVLEEYAIYRVLRLFTPYTLEARLLRVTYEDTAGSRRPTTRYAFVTEDPNRMARRLDGTFLAGLVTPIGMLSPGYTALVSIFQYFIGNTDWSLPRRHNIDLLKAHDTTFGVPFDFDWSGVIDAPYARPNPILHSDRVTERIFRGYCQDSADYAPVLDRFEALRDTIAALYRAVPGLRPRELNQTLRYYDEFYRAIADRRRFFHNVVERECLQ